MAISFSKVISLHTFCCAVTKSRLYKNKTLQNVTMPRQPHKGGNVILFIIFKLILTRRIFLSSLTCRRAPHNSPTAFYWAHITAVIKLFSQILVLFGLLIVHAAAAQNGKQRQLSSQKLVIKGLVIVTEWWQRMSPQFFKTAECWVYYTVADNFIVQENSICTVENHWVQVWIFFDPSTATKWHPPPANGTPRIVIFQAQSQNAWTDLEVFHKLFVTAPGLFLRKALSCCIRFVFQFHVSGTQLSRCGWGRRGRVCVQWHTVKCRDSGFLLTCDVEQRWNSSSTDIFVKIRGFIKMCHALGQLWSSAMEQWYLIKNSPSDTNCCQTVKRWNYVIIPICL